MQESKSESDTDSDSDTDTGPRILYINTYPTIELYKKVKSIFDEFRNENFQLKQENPFDNQTIVKWKGQPTPEAFKHYFSQ